MNLEELRLYDWCNFYDCQTNIKEKRSGARVGKYMAVSGYDRRWRLFQIYGGLSILDNWITSLADAVHIANVINEEYKGYLDIWEVWTDVDLIAIARLSVPNGEALYETICELQRLNRDINYQDFERIFNDKLLQYKK